MSKKRTCLITAEISNDLDTLLCTAPKEMMVQTPEGLVLWYARENLRCSEDQQLSAKDIAQQVNQIFVLEGDAAFSYQRVTKVVSNQEEAEKALLDIQKIISCSRQFDKTLSSPSGTPCHSLLTETELGEIEREALDSSHNLITYHHPLIAEAMLHVMELAAHIHRDVAVEEHLQSVNENLSKQKKWVNPLVAAYTLPGKVRKTVTSAPVIVADHVQKTPKMLERLLGKIANTSLAQAYEGTCALVRGTMLRTQQDVEILQAVFYACENAQSGNNQAIEQAGSRRDNVVNLLQRVASRG